MTDSPSTTATQAGLAAIDAAASAAAAQEVARASDTASLLSKVDEHLKDYTKENARVMTKSIKEIVDDALGRSPARFSDASRIPLICKSIFDIHGNIIEIKDILKEAGERMFKVEMKLPQYDLSVKLLFGFIGMILLAFAGSIIALVIKP